MDNETRHNLTSNQVDTCHLSYKSDSIEENYNSKPYVYPPDKMFHLIN